MDFSCSVNTFFVMRYYNSDIENTLLVIGKEFLYDFLKAYINKHKTSCMKANKFFYCIVMISLLFAGCNSSSGNKLISDTSNVTAGKNNATDNSHNDASVVNDGMFDSTKLKSDLNDIISSVASGNPDTTKLKNAASDIMTTDAKILSDSGIDKMYGNSNEPSVIAAKNALKKMRDGMGITPDKLDSIKKAAAQLKQETSH